MTADGQTRFCWSDSQQGLLKSAFFWGYLVLQIHGGTLAEKYGTRKVLGIALLISAILTLLTPVIAKWNIWALFVCVWVFELPSNKITMLCSQKMANSRRKKEVEIQHF